MRRDRTPDEIIQQTRGPRCGVLCLLLLVGCWVGTAAFLVGLATEPARGVAR